MSAKLFFFGGTHYETPKIFQAGPVLFAAGPVHVLSTALESALYIPPRKIVRRLAGQGRFRWKTNGIDSVLLQGQAGQPKRAMDQFMGSERAERH